MYSSLKIEQSRYKTLVHAPENPRRQEFSWNAFSHLSPDLLKELPFSQITGLYPDKALQYLIENYGTLIDVIAGNKILKVASCSFLLFLGSITALPEPAQAGTDAYLGTAGNFQIVSGGAITLGGAITGLDVANTSTSTPAINDLRSALSSLSATPAISVPADLGGRTYLPGTFASVGGAAFAMTSNIILDGNNDCESKFIFITPAAMNTTAGISITLINDAKASNIYWVVGGAITTGASNKLSGNFLSSGAMTIGASSTLDGRLLALAAITVGASIAFQGFPISGCAAPVGALLISVPASLEARSLDPGTSLVMEMDTATVTDTRGNSPNASWTVTTICSELSDGKGNFLGGQNFSYLVKNLSISGALVITPHSLTSMQSLGTILNAATGAGINSATWIPVITLSVPLEQVEGTYRGLITHSVF
jgi:hypothetical protein